MLIEHFVYSAALAVMMGMIFSHYTGRDPSWIIIAVALLPDIDLGLQMLKKIPGITMSFTVRHGDFHNIIALIFFSLIIAAAASAIRMRTSDAFICAALGIAAHFFEDALVYKSGYPILWPLSTQRIGIGIMNETPNLFGMANSTVLIVGLTLLIGALLVRTYIEGPTWWRIFLKGGRSERQSMS